MAAPHTRCPLRPSWPCRSPRPSSRPFLMSAACIRRPWQPSRPFQTADGLFWWPRRVWLSILDLNKAKIVGLSIKPLWSNGYESGLSPRRSGFDSPPELFPFNFQFLFIIDKIDTSVWYTRCLAFLLYSKNARHQGSVKWFASNISGYFVH